MYYGLFTSLRHYPAVAHVSTGYKQGKKPDYYYNGGFGTFVTPLIPASTILVLEINGGYAQFEVYNSLKEITNHKRFTKKFIETLESKLYGKTFTVTEDFRLVNFKEIVENVL